jgi:transcriptional regulator with XRE-family HTH domain
MSSLLTHMTRLPNYLRTTRKRTALSQEEVAFLLGNHGGAKLCRHERFACQPKLETILAFEAIYHKPASELFAGLYQEIQRGIVARAKILAHKIECEKPNRHAALRRQTLINITSKSLN